MFKFETTDNELTITLSADHALTLAEALNNPDILNDTNLAILYTALLTGARNSQYAGRLKDLNPQVWAVLKDYTPAAD